MKRRQKTSLTGSDCGAPESHNPAVSRALGQLRFGVVVGCVGVAIALLTQVVVFCLVEFTDLRWNEIQAVETAPTVIRKLGETRPRTLDTPLLGQEGRHTVNPNFVKSRFDSIFDTVASLSRGLGTMAMLGLTPLIVLGVLLAASAAMDGVDRTVSGFGWAMMVGILVLPVGDFIGLPWENGALSSYDQMTGAADGVDGVVRPFGDTVTVYARFLILPLMCLAGLGVTAVHFHLGVEDGLLVKEDLRIDPTLEKDAGGRKAGAMGSRSSAAFRKTIIEGETTPEPAPPAPAPKRASSIGLAADPTERTPMKPITPDDHVPPRRLI